MIPSVQVQTITPARLSLTEDSGMFRFGIFFLLILTLFEETKIQLLWMQKMFLLVQVVDFYLSLRSLLEPFFSFSLPPTPAMFIFVLLMLSILVMNTGLRHYLFVAN